MSQTKPLSHGAMIQDLNLAGQFAVNPATTTGLTFGFLGGLFVEDNAVTTVATGTVVLTASNTNYVYLTNVGAVANTVTPATATRNLLYSIVTDGSGITSITDLRGSIPSAL